MRIKIRLKTNKKKIHIQQLSNVRNIIYYFGLNGFTINA